MDLLKTFKKHIAIPNVKILLVLAVLVIVLLVTMFWSDKPDVYAKGFLPDNTTFYYQWSNNKAVESNPWYDFELFDDSIADTKINEVLAILVDSQSRLEELVWFKTDSDQDHYLLRLSSISQSYIDQLKEQYSELVFYRPHKKILLITSSQELPEQLPKLLTSKFTVNNINTGVSIYWDLDNSPEFLQKLSTWLEPMFTESEIFVNFQNTASDLNKINIWQVENNSLAEISSNFFVNTRRLYNFDNVIGFSADSILTLGDFVETNILENQFSSLPHYNFTKNDTIIWQYEKNWLMASDQDWQKLNFDLVSSFDLQKITKVLSDGTAYVEFVASSSPEIIQHAYYEQNYWQIDGLYGVERENIYYLSNKQYLIEDILSSDYMLRSIWVDCFENNNQINDFVVWQTNKLNNSSIKEYLESQDINSIRFVSYSNDDINGWQLCF